MRHIAFLLGKTLVGTCQGVFDECLVIFVFDKTVKTREKQVKKSEIPEFMEALQTVAG